MNAAENVVQPLQHRAGIAAQGGGAVVMLDVFRIRVDVDDTADLRPSRSGAVALAHGTTADHH